MTLLNSPKNALFGGAEYQEIFKDLFAIRQLYNSYEMLTDNVSQPIKAALPFVPIIPGSWGSYDKPKNIIWYGGASNGWDEDYHPREFNLDIEHDRNLEWLETDFKNRNNQSPFWGVQKECLQAIDCTFSNAIWSNIYKIGGQEGIDRGKPSSALIKLQSMHCLSAFKTELVFLNPDLVVLHVGEIINDIWSHTAGGWEKWEKRLQDSKYIAGFYRYHDKPLIWLSRRNFSRQQYVEAFKWALDGLGLQ